MGRSQTLQQRCVVLLQNLVLEKRLLLARPASPVDRVSHYLGVGSQPALSFAAYCARLSNIFPIHELSSGLSRKVSQLDLHGGLTVLTFDRTHTGLLIHHPPPLLTIVRNLLHLFLKKGPL